MYEPLPARISDPPTKPPGHHGASRHTGHRVESLENPLSRNPTPTERRSPGRLERRMTHPAHGPPALRASRAGGGGGDPRGSPGRGRLWPGGPCRWRGGGVPRFPPHPPSVVRDPERDVPSNRQPLAQGSRGPTPRCRRPQPPGPSVRWRPGGAGGRRAEGVLLSCLRGGSTYRVRLRGTFFVLGTY